MPEPAPTADTRHWNLAYEERGHDGGSWFQAEPALSLEIINSLNAEADASIEGPLRTPRPEVLVQPGHRRRRHGPTAHFVVVPEMVIEQGEQYRFRRPARRSWSDVRRCCSSS